jgi:hypothetical protein
MMNNNFSVRFLGPESAIFLEKEAINNYISRVEAHNSDWSSYKPRVRSLVLSEWFNVFFSMSVMGSGDTNGGKMLLNHLSRMGGTDGLSMEVCLFGEREVFDVTYFGITTISGDSKSSVVDFMVKVHVRSALGAKVDHD